MRGISIHAPREGSDGPRCPGARGKDGVFQSTLPVRGATARLLHLVDLHLFQSTLPVRGATIEGTAHQGGSD